MLAYLEKFDVLKNWQVLFCKNEKELKIKISQIENKANRIIGAFSFLSTQQAEIAEMVKNLRWQFQKKIILIAGGPHSTALPENTLQMGFDFVFTGEGEESFLQFVKGIESGHNHEIEKVAGICFYKNGKLVRVPNCHAPDLNSYIPCSLNHNLFGFVEITRGCSFACHFCQTSQIFGTTVRHRSIENLKDYANLLRSKNYTDFRTLSPNAMAYGSNDGFLLNLPEIEKMLHTVSETLGPNGRIFFGSFPSEIRPEHITKDSLDLIQKFAANKNIIIGAQSGCQNVLNRCNRGNTVNQIYNAVKLCTERKIKTNIDFIFGLPGETEQETNETFRFIDNLLKLGKDVKIHAHYFMPLPGTAYSQKEPAWNESVRKKMNLYVSKGFIYGPWINHEKRALNLKKLSEN